MVASQEKISPFNYVKIVNCSVPTYWYKNQVGKVFRVLGEQKFAKYFLNMESLQSIEVEDCVIITEEEYKEEWLKREQSEEEQKEIFRHAIQGLNN